MYILSFRRKQRLKKILLTVLIVLLLLAAFIICRIIYDGRFIVYQDGAAHLDFSQNLLAEETVENVDSTQSFPFETVVTPDAALQEGSTAGSLSKLDGVYITTQMLSEDMDFIEAALADLDGCNAVLIDVKSIYGGFCYSSHLEGAESASVDIEAVDALIAKLTADEDLTVIAGVPAFSDPVFALAHQSEGLPLASGALWTDEDGCYWLNPESSVVQAHLSAIASELYDLGFDEVVFENFNLPSSSAIVWPSDKTADEQLVDAATAIRTSLSATNLRIGFAASSAAVAKLADRVYLSDVQAEAIADLAVSYSGNLSQPEAQLVFLTRSHDTRYEAYGVLKPLIEDNE